MDGQLRKPSERYRLQMPIPIVPSGLHNRTSSLEQVDSVGDISISIVRLANALRKKATLERWN